ncbi:hypothetical protein, partial [Pseudomonas sp.]|uniref:DUF2515 family protein n=1 Tax=Pseudomonas sp. TaxID=306 RepID=UPI002609DF43
CGLLHAANTNEVIQAELDAGRRMTDSYSRSNPGSTGAYAPKYMDLRAHQDYQSARDNNPVPLSGVGLGGLMQQQFQHVYEMMALGNTTLFLDIFPLHAFYKKRGLNELRTCLKERAGIYGHPKFPVLWLVEQKRLEFGGEYHQILEAFKAIDKGDIAESVRQLAEHEQGNILQPTIYKDQQLKLLLRGNHASFVTGFPSGVAQSIELTLASQCQPVEDGRTLEFSSNPFADLSDYKQRIAFVLRAAERFDEMLGDGNRPLLEQSIKDIAEGAGVR